MLKTKSVHFSYTSTVSFQFPDMYCNAGETLLITGASGTGKTTLLHLLGGLLIPESGAVYINDIDIAKLGSGKSDTFRGRHIGIIFQQPHFVASLSVKENLLLASYLANQKLKANRADELLHQLGIAEQQNKKTYNLSQGQQQRVSIARALMNNPALILADEPTSSLDDENCIKVAELLGHQAKQANAALVIVTHDQRLKQIFHQTLNLS